VECGDAPRHFDGHAHACVTGAKPDQPDARAEEMMAAVDRLMRRG
jgi:hypothetical protein